MITCYRRQFAVGQGGLHFGIIKYPYEYIERFELMNERKEQVRNFYEKYPLRPEV